MVGQSGVGDLPYVSFRHMAPDAIVRGFLVKASRQADTTAAFVVASKTTLPKITRRFRFGWLLVRVVTSEAAQLAGARPITLTEPHRDVVFQQISLVASEGQTYDCDGLNQRSARPEVSVVLPRKQRPRIAPLVTFHANVFCKPRW